MGKEGKMISKEAIRWKTHYGLNIYAYVLRQYYPNETVISLSGNKSEPTKNPFLNHSETLLIYKKDGIFCHNDLKDEKFTGDVFDFAALHFNKQGQELLEEINQKLHLRIGDTNVFFPKRDEKPKGDLQKIADSPQFSYFRHPISNIKPEKSITIPEVYNLIQGDSFLQQTQKLRSITNKLEARKYKAYNFDYVTFSGVFRERSDNALVKHSNLLAIDFDHIEDIEELKPKLLNDKYFETELMFTSPSGDGLKWIIPIDLNRFSHAEYFTAVANYIKHTYNIEVDKSGKDISRACFLPYDNNIYINPKYTIQ